MAVIPGHIYRRIEEILHRRGSNVDAAAERLRDAEARATDISQHIDGDRVQTSGGGDRLERAAMAVIAARNALEKARGWEAVFSGCDDYFAGRDEARAARLLYGEHMTQQQVAAKMYVDRQTVRRWRDAYVTYCAMLAIEAGLIRIGGGQDE
jgi:hypothetical protein